LPVVLPVVLLVWAKAGCNEKASAINETQARVLVTATSDMLDIGRRSRDLSCQYAMLVQFIPIVRLADNRSDQLRLIA
jgi:hypothetical protein